MRTETFPAGKCIFKEGDSGTEAYRIIEGLVEISIQENAHKVVLGTLSPGEIFGEMAVVEQRSRSATARALEPLKVEVVTRDDFSASLRGSGDVLIPYLTCIFDRLRVTNYRLRSALKELEERGVAPNRFVEESKPLLNGPAIQICPDSPETQSQTVLQARTIRHFPFMLGRRGEVAGVGLFAENRLLVADRQPYRVSREHCTIEWENEAFFVRDLGSRLGTIVNGIRLGGPSMERNLRLSPGANTLILGGPDSQIRFILMV